VNDVKHSRRRAAPVHAHHEILLVWRRTAQEKIALGIARRSQALGDRLRGGRRAVFVRRVDPNQLRENLAGDRLPIRRQLRLFREAPRDEAMRTTAHKTFCMNIPPMLPELVNYGRLYREGVTATSEFLRLVGALNHQITVRFAGAGTGMSEAEAVPESGTKRPGR